MVEAVERIGDGTGCSGVERLPGETKGLNCAQRGGAETALHDGAQHIQSIAGKEAREKEDTIWEPVHNCVVGWFSSVTQLIFLNSTI